RGHVRVGRSAGRDLTPLAVAAGAAPQLVRMLASRNVAIIDDVHAEMPAAVRSTAGLRALAVVPVERRHHASLVVAMPSPEGAIGSADVRFLATLAGHLAVGLEKVRVYDELRAHRDRLEELVSVRTLS